MEKKRELRAIAAVNDYFHIGKEGGMLWRCSDDLKHFKKLTDGCTCVVGRKTAEGLPPLPGRRLLVVGHGLNHFSLEEALALNPDWVIGGGNLYKQLLPLCSELHLSHISDRSLGDTTFEIPVDFKGEIFDYWFEPNHKKVQ